MSPNEITYGNITIDVSKLPEASVTALIRRGVSHVFGNEAASRVAAFVAKEKDEGREVSDEGKADAKQRFQAEALEKLNSGTLGYRAPSVGVDPTEKVIRAIAKIEVTAILREHGLSFPTKDKTITFGDQTLTGDELIDRRIANHGDRLRKEAEAEIKRKAREAAKAAESAKANGGLTALL